MSSAADAQAKRIWGRLLNPLAMHVDGEKVSNVHPNSLLAGKLMIK